MPERIQISAVIDGDLRTEFDVACARRRLKLKDALEEALRDWVAKMKAEDKTTASSPPQSKRARLPTRP